MYLIVLVSIILFFIFICSATDAASMSINLQFSSVRIKSNQMRDL